MMTLKKYTPCDDGVCPYMDECGYVNCDWYCSAEEPQDNPEVWDEEESGD